MRELLHENIDNVFHKRNTKCNARAAEFQEHSSAAGCACLPRRARAADARGVRPMGGDAGRTAGKDAVAQRAHVKTNAPQPARLCPQSRQIAMRSETCPPFSGSLTAHCKLRWGRRRHALPIVAPRQLHDALPACKRTRQAAASGRAGWSDAFSVGKFRSRYRVHSFQRKPDTPPALRRARALPRASASSVQLWRAALLIQPQRSRARASLCPSPAIWPAQPPPQRAPPPPPRLAKGDSEAAETAEEAPEASAEAGGLAFYPSRNSGPKGEWVRRDPLTRASFLLPPATPTHSPGGPACSRGRGDACKIRHFERSQSLNATR